MEDNILYSSEKDEASLKAESTFLKHFSIMRNNFLHASSINIPLYDKTLGKMAYVLVIRYPSSMIFVDVLIPFICFIFFTLLFSRRFSRRIRKPLRELMDAVGKIKSRDLNFVISSSQEDEIGDLARAFEEMRENMQSSLMREWKLERDRRDMVSAITHDMRTPLAIIQGHVEGLQDGLKNDNEKLDAYLEIIDQNSQRAKSLIDEMNMLAEIDSPGFELSLCPVDFVGFLSSKTNEIEFLTGKKQIKIEFEVSDDRNERGLIFADSGRLSQVIDNIVGNAIRFTPQGGKIHFSVKIENNKASFLVCDTGLGFSEKDLPNLFKKFYKGDFSRSVEKGHSGLGLYISRSIIEKHGGRIQGSNMPDGGACMDFFITF